MSFFSTLVRKALKAAPTLSPLKKPWGPRLSFPDEAPTLSENLTLGRPARRRLHARS